MVMRIYNPLSQQEEDEMDRRFSEAVDTLEIVPEKKITPQRGSSLAQIADTRLSSAIEITAVINKKRK